jgi:hypothetical protein
MLPGCESPHPSTRRSRAFPPPPEPRTGTERAAAPVHSVPVMNGVHRKEKSLQMNAADPCGCRNAPEVARIERTNRLPVQNERRKFERDTDRQRPWVRLILRARPRQLQYAATHVATPGKCVEPSDHVGIFLFSGLEEIQEIIEVPYPLFPSCPSRWTQSAAYGTARSGSRR